MILRGEVLALAELPLGKFRVGFAAGKLARGTPIRTFASGGLELLTDLAHAVRKIRPGTTRQRDQREQPDRI